MQSVDALAKQPKEKVVNRLAGYIRREGKAKAQQGFHRGIDALACAGGGAAAGVLDLKYPNVFNSGVPASVPTGLALLVLSLSGYAGNGRNSQIVAETGKGMLAVFAAKKAAELWAKK